MKDSSLLVKALEEIRSIETIYPCRIWEIAEQALIAYSNTPDESAEGKFKEKNGFKIPDVFTADIMKGFAKFYLANQDKGLDIDVLFHFYTEETSGAIEALQSKPESPDESAVGEIESKIKSILSKHADEGIDVNDIMDAIRPYLQSKPESAEGITDLDNFPKVQDGEWVQPTESGYKMACCDCGLVHSMDFRIHNGKIQFRAGRNEKYTNIIRQSKPESAVTEGEDAEYSLRYSLHDVNSAYNRGVLDGLSNDDPNHNPLTDLRHEFQQKMADEAKEYLKIIEELKSRLPAKQVEPVGKMVTFTEYQTLYNNYADIGLRLEAANKYIKQLQDRIVELQDGGSNTGMF
jgi:hypothetical protein